MKRPLSLLVVVGTLAVLTGCGSSEPLGDPTPDAGSPDSGLPGDDKPGDRPDAGPGDGGSVPGNTLTWYRDVLPIVQTQCQECHAAGGVAPFSLESYADAKQMHASVASAVAGRRMPPWMADESCVSYTDTRRLTQAEIDTLVTWSETGAAEGNPADAPPPPVRSGGLPWVDMTLDPGADYTPRTDVPDD
ncbi:MAG TPA: cytochrome c, partial [Myxococcaceae bacterium]